jgi:GDP-4-dehydro-6-deoxy-D-mannose reductase
VKVLITGAGGFVGRHLTAHLRACGDTVIAADPVAPPADEGVRPAAVDVTDAPAVSQLVGDTAPDAVIHLAALAFVPEAERQPPRTIAVNVSGVVNLLSAVAAHRPQARILLVSSAEVYGAPDPSRLPLAEDAPTAPVNLYATTKLMAEVYARYAAPRHGLDLLIARPFTHVGPGQGPAYALSGFAQQLARIAAGTAPPVVEVGYLSARRDISDVRDVVTAYRLALEHLPSGSLFNICRGEDREIGEILQELIELSGLHVEMRVDPARLRPSDIPVLRGSAAFLHDAVGWQPAIPWRTTLLDLYNYWTNRLCADIQ